MTTLKSLIYKIILLLIGSLLSYFVSIKLLDTYEKSNMSKVDSSILESFPILKQYSLNNYEKQMTNNLICKENNKITFDDICGYNNAKEEFNFCLEMMKNKKNSELLTFPNGIILHGPPGTGKTMFAKACASSNDFAFINLCPSSFENQYYGESIKLLKACFDLAEKIKPCIIFIDEMDGFLSKRSDLDQHHINSLKTMFLTLMDGFKEKPSNILVIGATNRLNSIDDGVKRRMATQIFLDLPSISEIEDICKVLLKNEDKEDDFDYTTISKHFFEKYMSCSDVKETIKKYAKYRFMNKISSPWTSKCLLE